MECLEGETLAARLQRSTLPLADALRIAIDVAEALDHAHRHGIVHRDVKPSNVMLTRSGAKLLDFGVAKAASSPIARDTAATIEPLTRAGDIVGTPQYMAPEQIRGHPADHRTDIFAFGTLLHEVITGRRTFDRHDPADVMAAILNTPVPAVSTLQPVASPALDHVVARCLEKDPDQRWQSAFDLARELRWIADTTTSITAQPPAAATSTMRRMSLLAVGICGLLAGAAVYAVGSALLRQAPAADPAITRATVALPPNAQLAAGRPSVAISPDGRFLAFVARRGWRLDAVRSTG